MAVQNYAAGDILVAQLLLILFCEKDLSVIFLNESTFWESVLMKKKAAVKPSLPQSVPTNTEALLHFYSTRYVSTSLQNPRFHAKLHWTKESRIEVAFQFVKRLWSALSKVAGLGSCQTVYWLYFIYRSRTVLLGVLSTRSDGLSPHSWQELLDGVERSRKKEREVDKDA